VVRTCCGSEADGVRERVELREWKQRFRWPKANSFPTVPLYFNSKVVHKATISESVQQFLGFMICTIVRYYYGKETKEANIREASENTRVKSNIRKV
jgi:hypothetical protein